jgi:hypothetical protein
MTRFALALCLALAFALPASAGDVCVNAGNPTFVFKKVKSLKKPGSAVPLQGFYLLGGSAPVTGTAVVLQDGSVQFGVTVHTTPPLGAYPFTASLEGDADFNATGEFHGIDSGVSAPMAWTPIDCKSVTLP